MPDLLTLEMLRAALLAPLLLAVANGRAAQEPAAPTSNALDRVTIDVAGDGKQPLVVEVAELPSPIRLHYNVTTGEHGQGDGPVVIDLTEEEGLHHHSENGERQVGNK